MRNVRRMHKVALVAGLALIMAGGASIASAAPSSPTSPGWASWMDRMHDSPQMQQFRSQLPADLQKACDQMHDSMISGNWNGTSPGPGMMGGNGSYGPGMMGRGGTYGPGMMDGSGMMGY